jgi:ethanolamine utilization cobalamin adenosyltransferase
VKAITEAMVRSELKNVFPECYYVPEGMIVTPAAQEYLRFNKVKIEKTRTTQSEG